MSARWDTEKELAGLILAKAMRGKIVTLTPETALLIAQRLMSPPEQDRRPSALGFRLEIWDPSGSRCLETPATAGSYGLIKLIYDAVMTARPNDRVMVRQGARLVLDSGEPDPEAPKNIVQLR